MREVLLSDIAEMKYGKMPTQDVLVDSEDGFPVFSGYRITGYAKEYLYDDEMLIIVARGVGGTGDVKISPSRSWITNLCIVLKLDEEQVNKNYLKYLLNREKLKDKLNTGAAQAQITIDSLSNYKIRIPDFLTQCKVHKIISTYDDLIENNRRRIALLEESARLLYQEWFVYLRFPGYEHTRITDGIPVGWSKKNLTDIAVINESSLKNGFHGNIEYIDISCVSTNSINSTTWYDFKEAPGRARRVLKHGDIIWSCVRPNLKAHSFVWQPHDRLIASTGFAVISAKFISPFYLYQVLTTNEYVSYLTNHAGGAAYPAVTAKVFENSEILVPPTNLLDNFDQFVEKIYRQINLLHQSNKKLIEARDLLLPRLMNGEISV